MGTSALGDWVEVVPEEGTGRTFVRASEVSWFSSSTRRTTRKRFPSRSCEIEDRPYPGPETGRIPPRD